MTTTEGIIGYSVEVTPDFRLLVNDQEVQPPLPNGSRGPEADSEWALEWALDQVSARHLQHQKPMRLSIRDGRHGGYGNRRVVLKPGQFVDIGALRRRSKREYPIPSSQQPGASAPTPVQAQADRSPESSFSQPEPHPRSETPTSPPPAEPPSFAVQAPPTPPPTQPPPSEPPGQFYMSAGPAWATPVDLGTEPADDSVSQGGLEAFFGPGAGTSDGKGSKRTRRKEQRRRGQGQSPARKWSSKIGTGLLARKSAEDEQPATADPAPPSWTPSEQQQKKKPEGWMKYTRVIPRPGGAQDAAAASAEPGAPATGSEGPVPRRRVRARNIVIAVLAVLAVLVGIRALNAPDEQYGAVCIDTRTMVRQTSTATCAGGEATYYRWWYVPGGGEVPAAGGRVDEAQGSFVKPNDDASVDYEIAVDGGVVEED